MAGSISNCDAILQSKQFFISIEEEVVRENYKNEKLKYKFTEDFLNQLKPQADSKRSWRPIFVQKDLVATVIMKSFS